jgi:hypothetical protein
MCSLDEWEDNPLILDMARRLCRVEERVGGLERRLDRLERRLEGIDTRTWGILEEPSQNLHGGVSVVQREGHGGA